MSEVNLPPGKHAAEIYLEDAQKDLSRMFFRSEVQNMNDRQRTQLTTLRKSMASKPNIQASSSECRKKAMQTSKEDPMEDNMSSKSYRIRGLLMVVAMAFAAAGTALAETPEEAKKREMAEMQKMLNAEVMAKPFNLEEMSKIDAYIAESMKKNLVPQPYKGTTARPWRRGMTCAHLRGYYARRDCRYYYRYHGRYYPY